MLFFTDGVTERFDQRSRPYGGERLCRQLEISSVTDPCRILECIIEDSNSFSGGRPADDDMAMLLMVVD